MGQPLDFSSLGVAGAIVAVLLYLWRDRNARDSEDRIERKADRAMLITLIRSSAATTAAIRELRTSRNQPPEAPPLMEELKQRMDQPEKTSRKCRAQVHS